MGSHQDLAMAMSWPLVADVFDVKERDFHFDWKLWDLSVISGFN